jgi:Methyltransferase domain
MRTPAILAGRYARRVTGTAADRWSAALGQWAVPESILAGAGRSPWGHPVARFAARADAEVLAPSGASFERAVEALDAAEAATGQPGTVLDVGAGAGAASLPLFGWAAAVTALDSSAEMLAAFGERAAVLADRRDEADSGDQPVAWRTVLGSWPAAAGEAGAADLVVCHHVLFNVPDLGPFLAALTAAARYRVVVEVPPLHPLTWMNPLWEKFHGLARPDVPSVDDVVAVLHEQDVRALTVDRWVRTEAETLPPDERITLITRRLCLPPEREPEVATQLADSPPVELRRVATLTWSGSAPNGGPRRT